MTFLATILIGLVIGLIARFVKTNEDKMGTLSTVIAGIAGAFIGRFLIMALGIYSNQSSAQTIGAILGAVFIITGMKTFINRQNMISQ